MPTTGCNRGRNPTSGRRDCARRSVQHHFERLVDHSPAGPYGGCDIKGRLLIHPVDSKSVSNGLETLVIEVGKSARYGGDGDTQLGRVEEIVPPTHVFATSTRWRT